MLIDIAIILLVIGSFYRGREVGFVRQLFSTAGLIIGLFFGSVLLVPHTVGLAHTQANRALVTVLTTVGTSMVFLTIGEYFGMRMKHFVHVKSLNFFDNGLGGILSAASLLFSVWLVAAVVSVSPFPGLQTTLRNSKIVSFMDQHWPEAPKVLADLGRLVDPNGFPQVFVGNEPTPPANINLPSLGDFQAAVSQDEASVVKVEGEGCGGTVSGSGFVIGNGLVATNAHVIAGIAAPFVQDNAGTHNATAVWFDPNLDFAILKVNKLTEPALTLLNAHADPGTPAVALGYPGGGPLTASTAAVLDEITATGRNIYGNGNTNREVYEIKAKIIPGNSGGPLIDAQGRVIGVVFAQSTTYQDVGYSLASLAVNKDIQQAAGHNLPVSTRRCSD